MPILDYFFIGPGERKRAELEQKRLLERIKATEDSAAARDKQRDTSAIERLREGFVLDERAKENERMAREGDVTKRRREIFDSLVAKNRMDGMEPGDAMSLATRQMHEINIAEPLATSATKMQTYRKAAATAPLDEAVAQTGAEAEVSKNLAGGTKAFGERLRAAGRNILESGVGKAEAQGDIDTSVLRSKAAQQQAEQLPLMGEAEIEALRAAIARDKNVSMFESRRDPAAEAQAAAEEARLRSQVAKETQANPEMAFPFVPHQSISTLDMIRRRKGATNAPSSAISTGAIPMGRRIGQ